MKKNDGLIYLWLLITLVILAFSVGFGFGDRNGYQRGTRETISAIRSDMEKEAERELLKIMERPGRTD